MTRTNRGRIGLIALCVASMAAYTVLQQLSEPAFAWLAAAMAGGTLGWFIGSAEWRALGADLVAALVGIVCVMFGGLLPLVALDQLHQPLLWLAVGGGAVTGGFAALRLTRGCSAIQRTQVGSADG